MRGEDFTVQLQLCGCRVTRLWWQGAGPTTFRGRNAEAYGYKVRRQFDEFWTETTVSEQLVGCVGPEDEGALIRSVLEILKQQFLRRDTNYHSVPAVWHNETRRYVVPERSEVLCRGFNCEGDHQGACGDF